MSLLLEKIQSFLGPDSNDAMVANVGEAAAAPLGLLKQASHQQYPGGVSEERDMQRATAPPPLSVTPWDSQQDGAAAITPCDIYSLTHYRRPCFFVHDKFLGGEEGRAAASDARALHQDGILRPAGMSRGDGKWADRTFRGDVMAWMSELDLSTRPGLQRVVARLRGLRDEIDRLDRECGHLLRLDHTRTSIQVAYYGGDGKGYVRHRDAFHEKGDEEAIRCITMICYLNEGWDGSRYGGRLRLFLDGQDGCPATWEVEPNMGKVVVFRSDVVEHEVLPAFHPRLAVTCWCYGRPVRPCPKGWPFTVMITTPSGAEQSAAPRPLPLNDDDGSDDDEATIFVSIVSYRDSECQHTLVDLFETARRPERIRVGLVWQTCEEEDAACFVRPLPPHWARQVRTIKLDHREAAGPCWARHLAQALWCGEDYFLQIDSHMRFRPLWDTYLIQTLAKCPSSNKPVLTTYPIGYQLPNRRPEEERPTVLCPKKFDANGILRQTGRLCKSIQTAPLPSLLWASGFSFSRASVIHDAPYDPALRFLFFGEELSMAARMWTHGYDFFAPPETVIFHLWSREHRPSFREVVNPERKRVEANSLRRVKLLLGLVGEGDEKLIPHGRYGLGTERELREYQEMLGVDFQSAKLLSPDAQWAGRGPEFYEFSVDDEEESSKKSDLLQSVLSLVLDR